MARVKIVIVSILLMSGVFITAYNFYQANNLKYEFYGDASDFIHLGLTLAKTGKYGHLDIGHTEMVQGFKSGNLRGKDYEFAGHSTWRPPLWPALIAITFLISGYSLSFLIVFKFLLHLLGCLFFYKILQYLKIGGILLYVGAFLYLINPAWQLYSRVFLSEPITLFFITIFLWSLLKFLKRGKQIWLNGLIGGMLILVHPYYIFLPFSIWAFLFLFKKLQFKQILLLGGMAIFIVSLWVFRNSVVLETDKLLITTSSGAVMAKGWNEKVPQLHTNTKGDLAEEELVLQNFEYSNSNYLGHTGSMQLYQDATYNFIRSNPDLILPIIWKKLKSAFNPFPETPRPGILETGRVIYQFLALVAALILLWQSSKIVRTLVLGLFLSTIFITILTYSGFRFRMPQSGLEILFIVSAIHLLIERMKLYNFKRVL